MVEDYGKQAIATLATKVGPAVSTQFNFQPFFGIFEEERMLSHTFSKKIQMFSEQGGRFSLYLKLLYFCCVTPL